MQIKIKRLHNNAVVPKYAKYGDAGLDLVATDIINKEPFQITYGTGLAMEIPEGYELQVRPRSGMSLKTKMRVANSPGTIDSDYRGEICIIMENIGLLGSLPFQIKKGDRIAQGVICPVYQAIFIEDELNETERGEGGFGSTNK